MTYQIQIKRMPGNEDMPLPVKMSDGASGFDLHAAVQEPVVVRPGERALIPTGLAIAMPAGLEAQVRPRSGLALKHGVTALNSPGTIDADYRGEIKVILINHGAEAFTIQRKERIAQMVFQEIPQVGFIQVDELEDSDRGAGGFGHTGK